MRKTSSMLGLVAVVLGSLSIIGCGGGEDSGTAATSSEIPKATFVKRADAICSEIVKRVRGEIADSQAPDLREIVPTTLRTEAQRIEALPTPTSGGRELEAMLAQISRAIVAFEGGTNAKIAEAERLLSKGEALADSYGLRYCWLSGPTR